MPRPTDNADLVAAIRDRLVSAYEAANPGAEAPKGTSLWAALHAGALVWAPIYRHLPEEAFDEFMGLDDPEPPVTKQERDQVERGGLKIARKEDAE